jgi:plastocyanin
MNRADLQMSFPVRHLLIAAATLALTACKQSPPTPAAAPQVDPATAATVTGTVHFDGHPPARIPIDMALDPACLMAAEPNLTEQLIVNHGGLANVFVYVKSGAPPSLAPPNTQPVLLNQKGCRYVPHVVAVQQGGQIAFRNSDPTLHNVHTTPGQSGNASLDLSEMPMGKPQTETFHTPENMLPVRCNNHPWMQAFINVSPNPYYAISGPDGAFTLPQLPPGTYTLAAVHEKLGEQDIQITVAPKATAQANFSFSMR